ncbi:MAG: cupredoxin domain-containing protein [Cyanobacterium sp. T60_A2020_053]|nr:cupredoxin domain-containing protein [Cyanobacterium sp. T60_A2020_053]
MNFKKITSTAILSLGLTLGIASFSQAKTPTSSNNNQFTRIEQPLSLKLLITLGGFGLIGVELWWFLFKQTKSQEVSVNDGIQEIEIIVDGGYKPDRIIVNNSQPVRLKFLRKDSSSCLGKVLLPDFHKVLDLPLNQTTTVEFIPTQIGEYPFHCSMNMFRGILEVKKMNK